MRNTILVFCAASLLAGCSSISLPRDPGTAPQPAADDENELYLGVIDGLVQQGRHGAALAFLDSYARAGATAVPRYWLLRGEALLGLGRHNEASAAFAKLADTDLAAAGWNGMGRAAAGQGNWAAAEADFRKAVAGAPADANYLSNLGFAELHRNTAGRSTAWLQQAYELDPNSDRIRNNLVIALALNGDTARAEAIIADIKDDTHRTMTRALVKTALEKIAKGDKS